MQVQNVAVALRGSSRQSRLPALLRLPFPIRTIVRRWRGVLSILIGLSVALGLVLTLMGTIGTAMTTVLGDYQQSGANLYVAETGGKLLSLEVGSSPGTIDQGTAVISKLRRVPGVQAAVGELSWPLKQEQQGPQARNQAARFFQTVAVDGDPSGISNFLVMHEGRWFRRGNELVIGQGLSTTMSLGIGDSLNLNGQEYEIVGIGKLRGFGLMGETVAYVDAASLRQRGITGDVLNFVAVETTAPQTMRSVAADLSLQAASPDELTQQTVSSTAFKSSMVFYWVIDLFILFVAGMFVSNMLGRSVAERRTEFGTLRAIGLPSRTILISVTAEGVSILLVSYVLGFALALLLGTVINVVIALTHGPGPMFGVDPTGFFLIFLLTMALGLVAAYFPARTATQVDPLEVLRGV
jgi:ABC-type antimicrobial peptide transport system permease subunit